MTEIEVKPEHAADPNTRRVGILVAVVGVLLSVVTISAHRAHTKAVIYRTESNDEWSYYQAKKIRENTEEVGIALMQALGSDPAKTVAPTHKLDEARIKHAADAEKIQVDAHAADDKTKLEEDRALRLDIGEGLLELGLVLCSLYFLARKVFFPLFGILSSVAGAITAVTAFLL
jgi:hypothetical protein